MGKTNTSQALLVAVADPVLHPEAMHIAAATGRPIIDSTSPQDLARHFTRVSAVLIDAEMATLIASGPPRPRRERVFLLGSDPGPIDWQCAMGVHAEQALLLPAQAPELLAALGRENSSTGGGGGGVCIRRPLYRSPTPRNRTRTPMPSSSCKKKLLSYKIHLFVIA
ncbi:hypothetical protein [Corynebacterium pacaense]|uniref:hypothetical protein n=1 Tax=Corynebacterium pacaense TaxID=1816684 RepID=UPI0011774B39|nr:hypothetical protein [Corynebacterium pacaense]